MLTRRHVLGGLGAGMATAAWPGGMLVRADENSVTVTSLGGKWEQSIREDFIPLFKQRTGADVKVVLGAPTQWTSQIEALPASRRSMPSTTVRRLRSPLSTKVSFRD